MRIFMNARSSITFWPLKIPTTAGCVTWCQWAAACSTSIRTNSKTSRAAWAPEWRVTRCTGTEFTTNQATSCGVSLYASTTATWKSAGVQIEGRRISRQANPRPWRSLRRSRKNSRWRCDAPYWAGAGFSVKVDGHSLTNLPPPDSYVEITRVWKRGDTVALVLPKTLRTEPLPDNPERFAVMWGAAGARRRSGRRSRAVEKSRGMRI